jgi:hypothetical protein
MILTEKVKMDIAVQSIKERGGTEADVILIKMVYTDQELYVKILDSELSPYFNELCKKAIAYDQQNTAKKSKP